MSKINLIWCVKSQYEIDFSFDWINDVFSLFEISHFYDIENKFDIFINNSILIVCVGREKNERLINYIKSYNDKELNYTILHLSDENFEQNIDFYSVSKKILRNYFNKDYVKKYNILTIPLGYQSGIKYISTTKSYYINFIGQLKSDRTEMLSIFNNINDKYFYLTRMWGDPNGLNVKQFSDILSKSWFTLCPRGWISLDSFRINEALECKSIPLSILDLDGTDYFEKIYGQHPFIIGENWNDAFKKVNYCNKEQKSLEVIEWWCEFKKKLKIKIKEFIDD